MKRRDYKKRQKKLSKKRLYLKVGFFVTLSTFFVVAAYAASLQKKAVDAADRAYEAIPDRPKPEAREVAVEPAHDNVSILLIGVDDSEERAQGDNSRSDALLVATLNPTEKSVKLLSIPRDSYVYIPEIKKQDKITHAHAYGGTKAAIDTVEEMLDIPIDYYVKMNFNAFIEVVDALGGIEVEVPYNRLEKDENDKNAIQLVKGVHRLDGRHALALARTRKQDSDLLRGQRQQMIIQAMIKEATSVKSITKYGDVIDALGDNMKTDMTLKEMMSFLEYAKGGIPDVENVNIEGYDDWTPYGYYFKFDEKSLEDVKFQLKSHLELEPESSHLTDNSTSVTESADWARENEY
ncbi:LCP family protein [Sporosarcina sp. 179-K 3D1 HS]|uniref:LCP family protein n=1 Tax=Sporosarcina sp. 179-K 3D1 HS TaxID=3232169 RepID=UPI0039A31D1D